MRLVTLVDNERLVKMDRAVVLTSKEDVALPRTCLRFERMLCNAT